MATCALQRKYQELGLAPYMVHATFQYSGTPGKRHRLRWVSCAIVSTAELSNTCKRRAEEALQNVLVWWARLIRVAHHAALNAWPMHVPAWRRCGPPLLLMLQGGPAVGGSARIFSPPEGLYPCQVSVYRPCQWLAAVWLCALQAVPCTMGLGMYVWWCACLCEECRLSLAAQRTNTVRLSWNKRAMV